MRVLIWKGYGITEVYDYNIPNGMEQLKAAVIHILTTGYEKEDIKMVENAKNAPNLVEIVRELTYGDDNFESFELTYVKEI